jgi:hypothetical protein
MNFVSISDRKPTPTRPGTPRPEEPTPQPPKPETPPKQPSEPELPSQDPGTPPPPEPSYPDPGLPKSRIIADAGTNENSANTEDSLFHEDRKTSDRTSVESTVGDSNSELSQPSND